MGESFLIPRAVSYLSGVISTEAQLQAAVDTSTGTADNPTGLIVDANGLSLTRTILLKGKHIALTGGTIRRGAGFGGLLFQLGDDGNAGYQPAAKSTLLLSSITVDGGAVWTGGDNMGLSAQAALIGVTDRGSLVLGRGALLQNNENQLPDTEGLILQDGGGVVVCSGTVVLQGGVVQQNRSAGDGGGILFKNAAYNGFEMRAGEISGNSALGTGGGVYLHSRSVGLPAIFSGGSITGNRAGRGGGIALYSPDIYLSGSPVVRGNLNTGGKASNLALLGANVLYLPAGGHLGEGSWLGVTPLDYPGLGFARRLEGENAPLTARSAEVFHPDDNRYMAAVAPGDSSMLWLEPAQNPSEPVTIPISVTLSAGAPVYDGTPKRVTVTALGENGTPLPLDGSEYTLEYYRGNSTAAADLLPQPPVEAGSYLAIFSLTQKGAAKYHLSQQLQPLEFVVAQASQSAPVVTVVHESVAGAGDGAIEGLTLQMEWRCKGEAQYRPATSGRLGNLAPGVYQVRRKGDENHLPSPPTQVEIYAGAESILHLALGGPMEGVYGEIIQPVGLIIRNGGNGAVPIDSLTFSGDWATLVPGGEQVPAGGSLTDWALVPNHKLVPGSYTGQLTLCYGNRKEAVLPVICQIARRPLTASTPVFSGDKVYDGNELLTGISPPVPVGVVAGDRVELVMGHCSFEDKNVGKGKPLTLNYRLLGEEAQRYLPPPPVHTTGAILPQPLPITQVTAVSREYDGTTRVALIGGQISPLPGDEVVLKTTAANGRTAQAGVGSWPVETQGYSLAGADSGNYQCLAPQALAVEILPRTLVPSIRGRVEKRFDGAVDAMGSLELLPAQGELPMGEQPTAVGVFRFADPHAGRGKPLRVEKICLTALWEKNYRISQTTVDGVGDILPLERPVEWQGTEGEFIYTGEDQASRISASFTDWQGNPQPLTVACQTGRFLGAGEYTFTAQLPQEEGDYQLIRQQITLTMEKAPPALEAEPIQKRWYTGEPQQPSYTFAQQEGAVTVVPPSLTQPGEQAFLLKCEETDNYRGGSLTVSLSIEFLPAPQTGATLSPPDGGNGWYRQAPILTAPEGYTIAGGTQGPFGQQYSPLLPEGREVSLIYHLKNREGAITDQMTHTISRDGTPPQMIRLDTPPDHWVGEPIEVCLRLEETGSGLEQLLLLREGEPSVPLAWKEESCSFLLKENGEGQLLARDRAGNESRLALKFHLLDQTPPLLSWLEQPEETLWQGRGELSAAAVDEESGVASISLWEGERLIEISHGSQAHFSIQEAGEHTFVLVAEDAVGNRSQALRSTLKLEPAIDWFAKEVAQAGGDGTALLAVEERFLRLPAQTKERIWQSVQGGQAFRELEERLARWAFGEYEMFLQLLTGQEAAPTLAGAQQLAEAWDALPQRVRQLVTPSEQERVEEIEKHRMMALDFCRLTVPGPDSPAALTWWAGAYPALGDAAREMVLSQAGEECHRLWTIYQVRCRLEEALGALSHSPGREELESLWVVWESMEERERFLLPKWLEQGKGALAPLIIVRELEKEITQVTSHLPGSDCLSPEEQQTHLKQLEKAMLRHAQLDEVQARLLWAPLGESLTMSYAHALESLGHQWQTPAGEIYGLLGLSLPGLRGEIAPTSPPAWAVEQAHSLLPKGWSAVAGWKLALERENTNLLPTEPLLIRLVLSTNSEDGLLYRLEADRTLHPVECTIRREPQGWAVQFWSRQLGDFLFCSPVSPTAGGSSSDGSGEEETGFWDRMLEEIRTLSPGDTYRIEEKGITYLPARVVQALRLGQIHLQFTNALGECLLLWQTLPEGETGPVWWTLDGLAAYAAQAGENMVGKPNPDTGRIPCNGAIGGI